MTTRSKTTTPTTAPRISRRARNSWPAGRRPTGPITSTCPCPRARARGDPICGSRAGRLGGLCAFHLLDGRQYRDYQACPKPGRGGSNIVEACAERSDPNRSVLGSEQERSLTEGLARSRARWNLIAQQTLMARIDHTSGPGQSFWTDGWDGYPAARSRLLRFSPCGASRTRSCWAATSTPSMPPISSSTSTTPGPRSWPRSS